MLYFTIFFRLLRRRKRLRGTGTAVYNPDSHHQPKRTIKMKYIEENRKIWDARSENNDTWSVPVTSETINRAREGVWSIVLTPAKPVPASWFPENLRGVKILCLASGGGQQGPVLAAVGAEVTVFDNSIKQLEKDIFVAQRDNLTIRTVQGNMQDLSVFEDESFDCIVHPWSNGYIDDVRPVWKECARVLKKNGLLNWQPPCILALITVALGIIVLLNPFSTMKVLIMAVGVMLIYNGASSVFIHTRKAGASMRKSA